MNIKKLLLEGVDVEGAKEAITRTKSLAMPPLLIVMV